MGTRIFPEYEDYQLYHQLADNQFDAFANAQSADQYLDAPATNNATTNRFGQGDGQDPMFDISSNRYFDISPEVNIHDEMTLHFLVQSTIAAAKGFKVLSYQEIEDHKERIRSLKAQLSESQRRLELELKMKDAAASMSKLSTSNSGASQGQRKSFLFNKDKKRLSKQVEEEVEVSHRKIEALQNEIPELRRMISQEEMMVVQHHVAVLALTHPSSESKSARIIEQKRKRETRQIHSLEDAVSTLKNCIPEERRRQSIMNDGNISDSSPNNNNFNTNINTVDNDAPEETDSNVVVAELAHKVSNHVDYLQNQIRTAHGQVHSGMALIAEMLERIDPKESARFQGILQARQFSEVRPLAMATVQNRMKHAGRPAEELESIKVQLEHKIDENGFLKEKLMTTEQTYNDLKIANDNIQNEHYAMKSDLQDLSSEHGSLIDQHEELKQKHVELERQHEKLQESHDMLRETFDILQQQSVNGDRAKASSINNTTSLSPEKGRLAEQFEALNASYEANRTELEKLELDNVDLRNSLQECKFTSKAEITQLENELKANMERVQEWRERCEALQVELESVVKSLEDVTRQAVDYESERVKLEQTIQTLQTKLLKESNSTLDKRVSMIGAADEMPLRSLSGSNEPLSVSLIRHEFRKIIREISDKHQKEVKLLQDDKKKLERLLRSVRTSSYMGTLSQETLSSLSAIEAAS